jgi:hypothetical protein
MSTRSDIERNLAEGEIVDIRPLRHSSRNPGVSRTRAGALLRDSLAAAMKQLRRYSRLVNVYPDGKNINESVFRFLVVAEIMRRDPEARCQTEWKKFDMLLATSGVNFLVEFKFYQYPRMYDLDGEPKQWKGGPGPKNVGEFKDCVKKLKKGLKEKCDNDRIAGKYLVLVYQKGPWRGERSDRRHSFEKSYDDLRRFGGTAAEEIGHCHEDCLACKLITID